jgi:hypothetical protein
VGVLGKKQAVIAAQSLHTQRPALPGPRSRVKRLDRWRRGRDRRRRGSACCADRLGAQREPQVRVRVTHAKEDLHEVKRVLSKLKVGPGDLCHAKRTKGRLMVSQGRAVAEASAGRVRGDSRRRSLFGIRWTAGLRANEIGAISQEALRARRQRRDAREAGRPLEAGEEGRHEPGVDGEAEDLARSAGVARAQGVSARQSNTQG